MASSSPAPSPVRLSPVWTMVWSGVDLLLKKTKWPSETTLPVGLTAIAEASRSKSTPVVVRTSQPRPTVTAARPGASFVSETLPPLDRLTAMGMSLSSSNMHVQAVKLPLTLITRR